MYSCTVQLHSCTAVQLCSCTAVLARECHGECVQGVVCCGESPRHTLTLINVQLYYGTAVQLYCTAVRTYTAYRHVGTITTKFSCHMTKLPEKLWPCDHADARVDATTMVLFGTVY